MKKLNTRAKNTIIRIISSFLLCFSLSFSLLLLSKVRLEEVDIRSVGTAFGFATLSLSVYTAICLFTRDKNNRKAKIFDTIFISLFFIVGVLGFLSQLSPFAFIIGASLYLASPIIKRVESILRNRSKSNVVLNVLMGIFNLFISVFAISALFDPIGELFLALIVGIFMLLFCLFNIALTAISNFNRGLLKKIIRKTYAGEILFGLLLLIVAFSMAFTILEEKMSSFADALWYCFAIITTIGFGDFAASSLLGRILSVILGIYGIIVVAIITSIIVNFYNEVKTLPSDELPKDDNPSDDVEPDNQEKEKIG